jgi:hypothetical protein
MCLNNMPIMAAMQEHTHVYNVPSRFVRASLLLKIMHGGSFACMHQVVWGETFVYSFFYSLW